MVVCVKAGWYLSFVAHLVRLVVHVFEGKSFILFAPFWVHSSRCFILRLHIANIFIGEVLLRFFFGQFLCRKLKHLSHGHSAGQLRSLLVDPLSASFAFMLANEGKSFPVLKIPDFLRPHVRKPLLALVGKVLNAIIFTRSNHYVLVTDSRKVVDVALQDIRPLVGVERLGKGCFTGRWADDDNVQAPVVILPVWFDLNDVVVDGDLGVVKAIMPR